MIDLRKSAELNNMEPIDLYARFKKFPGSNKRVIRVCDNCGREDEVIYNNHPDLCRTCTTKKAREDDPTIVQRISETTFKRFEDPLEREKTSIGVKKAHVDDPTISERQSKAQKKSYQDDPTRSPRQIKNIKKTHLDNPSIGQRIGEAMSKHYAEMDDPGQEIVNHHYLYDHDDLSLNTVKMVRSDHGKLHALLRKLEYKVPHINEVI